MPEMKQFTVEGEATLCYTTENGPCVSIDDERLVDIISRQLEFPNDEEWNTMYERLDSLREQGLMPAMDEPDIERSGIQLRVTVEVF